MHHSARPVLTRQPCFRKRRVFRSVRNTRNGPERPSRVHRKIAPCPAQAYPKDANSSPAVLWTGTPPPRPLFSARRDGESGGVYSIDEAGDKARPGSAPPPSPSSRRASQLAQLVSSLISRHASQKHGDPGHARYISWMPVNVAPLHIILIQDGVQVTRATTSNTLHSQVLGPHPPNAPWPSSDPSIPTWASTRNSSQTSRSTSVCETRSSPSAG